MSDDERGRRSDRLMGYTDRLSVAPGEAIKLMVSSDAARYDAEVVRLTRGGPRTRGAAETFAYERVGASVDGTYAGRVQPLHIGSYARVDDGGHLGGRRALTLQAWVCPTAPGGRVQGVLTRWCARSGAGFGLVLDEHGAPALRVGDQLSSTGVPLLAGHWYLVAASFDLDAGRVMIAQRPLRRYVGDPDRALAEHRVGADLDLDADVRVLIGGEALDAADGGGADRRVGLRGGFDGKVEAPCVLATALDRGALERVLEGADGRELAPDRVLADWDFCIDMPLRRIADVSGAGLDGETVNSPLRAVTGRRWSGDALDHRLAPREYGAIHFHADDLDDAGWEPAWRWEVPADARSGAYAVRLRAGQEEDFVTFFVRPPRDRATARVAVLASTFTYLAYSNYQIDATRAAEITGTADFHRDQVDAVLAARGDLGRSLYNRHGDGSGVAHVSRLRPLLNMRPTYRWLMSGGGGWSFGGDMYLLDWLGASGVEYDVIADEDVHEDGVDLLQRYAVVLTGMHPEYVSGEQLDAFERYTASGGRLMYLGGNGFYWVTTVLPDRPHVIELRRGLAGTRAWASEPGEEHHTTGEPGGLWRHRGRAPQRLVGVGFAAQGGGPSVPYRRLPASWDPRAAFVFEGVPEDAPIGDFGNNGGGAAGEEVDRADHALGTPPHALVMATSQGAHSDLFQHVIEEVLAMKPNQGGSECPDVRADLTFFETPGGGAVFSTGSIDWIASLGHDDYDNDVARITGNVLRRFLDPAPLWPRG